ncbi:zinc-dependent metalloprotease [Taibaiella koreensis]|uniref:zinc-dependent metalloprotease n=1 Tax=Taibaiella koreensis TaxID=1268548 RepID=UPI0013C3464E|nr:zinc-dependent metalloprotease [Taibaiella koreensis]
MKKQRLSILLGIGLYLCTGIAMAQTNDLRPLDRQVSQAKTQGLFTKTYSLFHEEQGLAKRATDQVVTDATYLQLEPEQTQRLFRERPEALTLSIPVASAAPLELELVQQSPLDKSFFVSTSADINKPVSYTPGVYYRGIVKGMPQTTVAISVFEDEIIGIASTPNQGNLVLGRLQAQGNGGGYILYSDMNLHAPPLPPCQAVEPLGYTEKMREYLNAQAKPTADKCVKVFLECDYALNTNKGGVAGATNFITAVFNNIAVLYANESITTAVSQVMVWTSQDPYSTTNSNTALNTFRTTRTTFNGDIAHLAALGGQNIGGVAWIDILCNNTYRYAYSNIYSNYSTVPTYSWSVGCMAHEMGHNLGSPHTHNCTAWSGGAIDGCGPAAGYPEGTCTAPVPSPSVGGTIMSYCHLLSAGINFNNGFGPQPGNLIRSRVNAATCLSSCTTSGCTTNSATLTIVLDNYPEETSWNITNSASQVVASGGTYGSSPDGSTITVPLCLPNGCYTLTMLDAYGDGICCSYGNGSYTLKNNANNAVLASGGQYTSQDVKTFCFNAGMPPQQGSMSNISSLNDAGFMVYPNPARDLLHVRWTGTGTGAAQITFTDLAGRKIASYTVNSVAGKNSFDIPLQQMPTGMYLLQLDNGSARFQQKVMVQQR